MSFHTKLARISFLKGRRSTEFTVAAQRHADAAWFLLIFAVVVWYFWGWGWALIPIMLGVYAILKSISSTMVATRLTEMEQPSEDAD